MDNLFQRALPQLAVKNGGSMTVISNTEPLGHLKLVSGASLLVTSGGMVRDITNSGGTAVLADGTAYIDSFTAQGLTAGPAGKVYMNKGATVSSSIASGSGAVISILSSTYIGSLIKDCTAISSGIMYVRGSGIAGSNLTVSGNANTRLYIQNPMTKTTVSAVNCSAVKNGRIYISGGGTLVSGYTATSGVIYLAKPKASADTIRMSGGYVSVYSGGAGHNISAAPGIVRIFGYNTSPSVVSNVHVGANGTCNFFMNQTATDTASKGSCIASDVYISSAKAGSALIKSGATVYGVTIDDNQMNVLGGVVYLNSVGSGAIVRIHNNASAGKHDTGGIIKGQVPVRAGYLESNTVQSGGVVALFYDYLDLASTTQAPGIASALTVAEGGTMTINQSCIGNTIFVNSGGTLTVSSGGTATDVVSNAGAVVNSQAGAVINYRGE